MIARASVVRAAIARHYLAEGQSSARLGSVRLHAHQRSAVDRLRDLLQEHRGALLADEAGLGKTYVAAALMRECERPLLVIPAALKTMWRDALAAAGVSASVTTYSALSRGTVPPGDFDLLVLDEAHHARTTSTQRYGVIAALAARARVLLITATPVHNRRAELAALFALFAGARAYAMGDAELARLIVRRERGDVADVVAIPDAPPPQRIVVRDDALMLRDLLALPPPLPPADGGVGGVLLAWSLLRQWASSHAALAGALRRRIARGIALENALEAGTYPTRRELGAWSAVDDAIQLAFPQLIAAPVAAPHAMLARVREHLEAVRALLACVRADPSVDASRVKALRDIRERHVGEKVLVFSQFADTVRAMFTGLRDTPWIAALTSRGGRITSGRLSRQETLERFAPRATGARAPAAAERIDMLLTTDLASEGLNLHDASVIVHLDLPWTPARLEQRVARSRRIGARHARTHSYAFAPPANTEAVLSVERRLRAKLRTMEEVIGSTGDVLPALKAGGAAGDAGDATGADATHGESSTRLRERIDGALRRWREREETGAGVSASHSQSVIACVAAPRPAVLALALDGARATLAAALGDGELTEDAKTVLEAIELIDGVDVGGSGGTGIIGGADAALDARVREDGIARAERWLARRAGGMAGDTLAWRGTSRRVALRRIAALSARTPHHRRALLAPLTMVARRVVSAPYALGAERVLDEIASAPLPDEAWLRALASFGAMHGDRESQRGDARVVAMIIAG